MGLRKTGFLGRHADIRWIVTRHILRVGADDYRDDQRLAVNGVGRDHQDRSVPSLFPTVGGAEADEVNLARLIILQPIGLGDREVCGESRTFGADCWIRGHLGYRFRKGARPLLGSELL